MKSQEKNQIRTSISQIVLLIFALLFSSCRVTKSSIVGYYKMKNFPKSIINIKSDTTFEFVQNYRNPYLHPFEHPNDNYFRTTGRWTLQNKTLTLNSSKDSLTYKLYDIVTSDTAKTQFCNYVFYDIYNDTVPILFVKTNEGHISRLHSSMDEFSYDKTKKENLEFFFFGYRPLKINNSQNGETNYIVYLQPEFRPNWFIETKFKVKKNLLKHLDKKIVFKK